MEKIELLVPAGNKESFMAAIASGADAIYVGGQKFSARALATNFTKEELQECISYAHIRGVKVHVGVNTLLYDEEFKDVLEFIDFLYLNDIDAIIIADFGLISIAKERYPDLSIHVSTQLNTINLWQIKWLESMNVDRIVLARETSLASIIKFKENTNIELEVFAHGSLCVCFSGQCLHSSMIGKRSGNRGSCAQPCRMEYQLMEDNRIISDKKYLLSMKDLNTLEHIDELIKANITSLKIEGRMKSPEYVALVTKAYREAIDRYYDRHENIIDRQMTEKLKLTFSRDFTKGHLFMENNALLTNAYRPNNIGIPVGKIVGFAGNRVKIKLTKDVFQQDKIVILQEKNDIGIYLSKIYARNRLVSQGYAGEIIEIELTSRVNKDAMVHKVIDHVLQKEIQEDMSKEIKRIPIRMKFFAEIGEVMTLTIKDQQSRHVVMVQSDEKVEKAISSPTSKEKIQEQLSKVKSTCYDVAAMDIRTNEEAIIPVRLLNELRRKGLATLDEARANVYHRNETDIKTNLSMILNTKKVDRKFKVKVHTIYQLKEIADLEGIDEVYYDDLTTFKIAKERYNKVNLIPVLPRVDEEKTQLDVSSNTYVVNQLGDLLKYQSEQKITDLYLNVVNIQQVAKLLEMNVKSITLAPELSKRQIINLLNHLKEINEMLPPLEMVVYGHIQTMITKYCFIAKELGYEKKNCGACRSHSFSLLDRMNYKFPVMTDKNCNVTILNSKALHLIPYLHELYDMGISSLRLDFTIESPQEVKEITQAYLQQIHAGEYSLDIHDVTYGYFLDE